MSRFYIVGILVGQLMIYFADVDVLDGHMENVGYDVSAAEARIEKGQQYLREDNKSALTGHTA